MKGRGLYPLDVLRSMHKGLARRVDTASLEYVQAHEREQLAVLRGKLAAVSALLDALRFGHPGHPHAAPKPCRTLLAAYMIALSDIVTMELASMERYRRVRGGAL